MSFFSLSNLGLLSSTNLLLQQWLTSMQTQYPGYSPSAASLEYIHAQILASQLADLAQLASAGGDELFRTYGTTLVGVPYQLGTAATAVVTISAAQSPLTLTVTSSALSTGGPTSSLPIVGPQDSIAAGTITLADPTGVHGQTWTTTGASAGDTSLPVTSQTPNFAYPVGSTIAGTSVYTLDALSLFSLDQLGFYNLVGVDVTAGTSASVSLTAVQTGVLFNGAGSSGDVQLNQQLPWVTSVTLTGSGAGGGQDPEDDAHYRDRLVRVLQLQAPRPITAPDFAGMAVSFTPATGTDQQEVGRATAVDGYNPVDASFNNQKMVTVCVTDSSGFALNSDTMYGYTNGTAAAPILTTPSSTSGWGVQGWLQGLREVNFVVNVITPTYSAIYLTVSVKARLGLDVVSVKSAVQSALLNYFAPNTWGLPVSTAQGWQNTTTAYLSNVAEVIMGTGVVDHITANSLTMGLSLVSLSGTDLVLPGPVALPVSNVSTIPTSAISVT